MIHPFKSLHQIIMPIIAGTPAYIPETETSNTVDHAKDFEWFNEEDAVQFFKLDLSTDPDTGKQTVEVRDITFDMAEAWMAEYAKDRAIDDWSEDHLPLYVRNAKLYQSAKDDAYDASLDDENEPSDLQEHGTLYSQKGSVVG